jgi:hypothetical protein
MYYRNKGDKTSISYIVTGLSPARKILELEARFLLRKIRYDIEFSTPVAINAYLTESE